MPSTQAVEFFPLRNKLTTPCCPCRFFKNVGPHHVIFLKMRTKRESFIPVSLSTSHDNNAWTRSPCFRAPTKQFRECPPPQKGILATTWTHPIPSSRSATACEITEIRFTQPGRHFIHPTGQLQFYPSLLLCVVSWCQNTCISTRHWKSEALLGPQDLSTLQTVIFSQLHIAGVDQQRGYHTCKHKSFTFQQSVSVVTWQE